MVFQELEVYRDINLIFIILKIMVKYKLVKTLVGIVGGGQQVTIQGCKNFGNVIADTDTGGIVGFLHTSSVINCINYGNIESSVQGAGGIVGGSSNLKGIINCYSAGNITGNKNVGGIIGDAGWTKQEPSPIENCYTTGNIKGSTNVRGILGIKGGYGTHVITNCYWPEELGLECGTDKSPSDGALTITNSVAKSRTYMKTAEFLKLLNDYVDEYNTANASNTDFVELKNWVLDSDTGYPVLDID